MPEREYTGSAAELAEILNAPDDWDGTPQQPVDGQPEGSAAEATVEEPEETVDEFLSPAERVAEAVRQDREARGEEVEDEDTDDEDDDEGDEEDDSELAFLRRYYEEREQETVSLAERNDDAAIRREADAEYHRINAHFDAELERVTEEVINASMNSASPETYRKTHLPAAHAANRRARQAQIDQHVTNTNEKLTASRQKHQRPRYLRWLIEQNGLPNNERIRNEIDEEPSVDGMARRAAFLGRMRKELEGKVQVVKQAKAEAAATHIRQTQVHAGDTGRPRRSAPIEYAGTAAELAAIEALQD